MTRQFTIGSLFSGYGGLDGAVEQVMGARTAWVSDVDKGACKVLAHRYPNVPNLGDVTSIDWADVQPVDIITGGSPCQDLSTAGRRAGMTDGTRSNLWVAMREAIAHVRPRFVIWENVAGAYSAHAHSDLEHCPGCMGDPADRGPVLRALHRVVGDLSDLGYDTEWRPVRASDVGACHRRLRVFVLAWRRDGVPDDAGGSGGHEAVEYDGRGASAGDWAGVPHQPDRLADGAGPDGGLTLLPAPRATDGTKGGPNQRGSSGDLMLPSAVVQMLPTPTARDYKDHMIRPAPHRPDDTDSLSRALAHLLPTPVADNSRGLPSAGTDFQSLPNAVVNLPPTPSVADTQGGRKHRSGDRNGELLLNDIAHHEQFGQYAAAIARHERMIGRPAPSPVEPGRNGKPRLSAAFTEWMMGLPAGWITDTPDITRNEALKLCGNGVVPQQAAAALRDMLSAMRQAVAA